MGSVMQVEQESATLGSAKVERRALAWTPIQPLDDSLPQLRAPDERADEMIAREQIALPIPAPFYPRPTGPALSTASALAWGELSALIWGDIADIEVSTQRLTLKLRLASLMAKRKSKKA
jgi:hypothetical protein